jgi:hypothetical protein
LVFVEELRISFFVLKSAVNAFLLVVGRRFRFWGLFVVDEDVLVIFVQAVNPYGRSMGEEGAVLFYCEGDGHGRRFSVPSVKDWGGVVIGAYPQLGETGALEQHLEESAGRRAGRQIPLLALLNEQPFQVAF